MGLGGWNENQKLILTIDSSKVDEDLTNFPVNITLSSGTGQTGFDATPVFDELSAISGTKNIAITDSSYNQLYVEIESWDWDNEQAILWTKVPTITSGTDTTLYLYYDATVSGNTTYIGDTGDSAAQNVWDDDFIGVWHMAQDPTGIGYCMLDSTSNEHHGDPGAAIGSNDLIDGQIGKAIEFDGTGTGDRIDLENSADFDFGTDDFTIEHIIYPISNGTVWCNYSSVNKLHVPYFDNATAARIIIDGTDNVTGIVTTNSVYQQFFAVRSGNELKAYINNSKSGTTGDVTGKSIGASTANYIGCSTSGPHALSGRVDELRISTTERNAAWRKATYYSNWNDLITFSDETIMFYFSNPIPTDLSKVYGITTQLYLTTTITGAADNYIYDAIFYDAYADSVINTVSGVQSGQSAGVVMPTPSGIDYQWYMTATSSGSEDTSDTYTFTNRFLCAGQTQINDASVSGVPVRLYLRETGELIGSDISTTESGVFSIETSYNDYHYIVGLYTSTVSGVDVTKTNALIYDHLKPSE